MRDAAEYTTAVTAKLRRELDERECKQRNALSTTMPGFALRTGDVGTVLDLNLECNGKASILVNDVPKYKGDLTAVRRKRGLTTRRVGSFSKLRATSLP